MKFTLTPELLKDLFDAKPITAEIDGYSTPLEGQILLEPSSGDDPAMMLFFPQQLPNRPSPYPVCVTPQTFERFVWRARDQKFSANLKGIQLQFRTPN